MVFITNTGGIDTGSWA